MRCFRARLFPSAAAAREHLLSVSLQMTVVYGVAAGLATVATAVLLVEAFFVSVGLLASVSTIESIGAARFSEEGTRLAMQGILGEAARGGISLLSDIWLVLVAIAATGTFAGAVHRRVGQARASWAFIGAWMTFFALATIGFIVWARRARLEYAEQLGNAEFWAEPGRLYRLLDSDAGLLAGAGAAGFVSSWAAFAIWRWWLIRLAAGEVVHPQFQRDSFEDLDPKAPASYREFQERMRRLKRDTLELRSVETRFSRPDPILESTHVVDREIGRRVPEWMEPMAGVNSLLGKPFLVVFILAAFLWFGMGLAGQRQSWLPQRGTVVFTPDDSAKAIVFTADESSGVLRLFGLTGRGILDIGIRPVEGGELQTLATAFSVDSPQGRSVRSPPGLTYDLTGKPGGEYRLTVKLFAGDRVEIGYSLGHRILDSWRVIALLIGLAGAGLVFSGVGLTMIGAANFVAYWRR